MGRRMIAAAEAGQRRGDSFGDRSFRFVTEQFHQPPIEVTLAEELPHCRINPG